MTEAEITTLVERIVDEKLAERDQKTVAALAEGMWRGLRQAESNITLDGKRLARIVADQHRRDERRHGSLK